MFSAYALVVLGFFGHPIYIYLDKLCPHKCLEGPKMHRNVPQWQIMHQNNQYVMRDGTNFGSKVAYEGAQCEMPNGLLYLVGPSTKC